MKEGTKVKVVASISGHDFDVGEIVERRCGEYEDSECLGFYSKEHGIWYMTPDEYEIVDKNHAIYLMVDAMNMAMQQGFSREVWERIAVAIENAEAEKTREDETD